MENVISFLGQLLKYAIYMLRITFSSLSIDKRYRLIYFLLLKVYYNLRLILLSFLFTWNWTENVCIYKHTYIHINTLRERMLHVVLTFNGHCEMRVNGSSEEGECNTAIFWWVSVTFFHARDNDVVFTRHFLYFFLKHQKQYHMLQWCSWKIVHSQFSRVYLFLVSPSCLFSQRL